jgi:rhodanese-related sulfurtransferase
MTGVKKKIEVNMIILDVREKEEFEAEYIPDSICCPLSQFDLLAPGILKNIKDSDILVMCRSGNRAKMALNELKKFDVAQHRFTVFEGGILKWKNDGKIIVGKGSVFPIMRQVQIVASSMIFFAFLGSKFISHDFVYLALFVGFGLALAGYTGFCPMVFILQKMPWNNKKTSSCNVTNNTNCCG